MTSSRITPAQLAVLQAGRAEAHDWYSQLSWVVSGKVATYSVKRLLARGLMERREEDGKVVAVVSEAGRRALAEGACMKTAPTDPRKPGRPKRGPGPKEDTC